MPVIFDSSPVIKPDDNQPIAQYISVNKFISLIQKNSMFFCRLDQLEDKFEGRTSKGNLEGRKEWWRRHTPEYSEEKILEKIKDMDEMEKKIQRLTCVNCWNKFNHESAALWKVYSENLQGIVIKTTVHKLIESFKDEENSISISEVRYVDKNKDETAWGNTNYPIIYKHNAYVYEDEIRLFHEVGRSSIDFNWDGQEYPKGKYFNVNVKDLIGEIIVGPFTEKYVFDIIVETLNKYEIKTKVTWSTLKFED